MTCYHTHMKRNMPIKNKNVKKEIYQCLKSLGYEVKDIKFALKNLDMHQNSEFCDLISQAIMIIQNMNKAKQIRKDIKLISKFYGVLKQYPPQYGTADFMCNAPAFKFGDDDILKLYEEHNKQIKSRTEINYDDMIIGYKNIIDDCIRMLKNGDYFNLAKHLKEYDIFQ